MGKPESFSLDQIQELEEIAGDCWRLEASKRFQCVWLLQVLKLSPKDIAEALRLNIATVRRIHAACEAKIGIVVNKTTIHRLLERHGWGNIATRIHHPGIAPVHASDPD